MARIQFASTSEEILGRLAGSVFQDSYFGMQVRGLPKPRNPQTQLQQLRRGNFRFLSSSWRYLSAADKSTWEAAAGTTPEALRLFIGSNINLILIGLSVINSYTASPAPDGLELLITGISDGSFAVMAPGAITSVPAGCRLLILATTGKQLPKLFTNPAAYQPITYFDEGTDFSSAVNIFAAWQSHYGQLQINTRICIKTAVISKSNGSRSAEFINCAITIIMAEQFGVDDNNATADREFTLNEFAFTWQANSGSGNSYFQLQGSEDKPEFFFQAFNGSDKLAQLDIQNGSVGIECDGATSSNTIHANTSAIELRYSDATIAQIDLDDSGATITANLISLSGLQEYTDNADAIANGLIPNNLYRTGDFLKIVH